MRFFKLEDRTFGVPEYDIVLNVKDEINVIQWINEAERKGTIKRQKTDPNKYKETKALNNFCTNKIGVFLTTACQLSCQYCYYDSDNKNLCRQPEVLEKKQMQGILNQVYRSSQLIAFLTHDEPKVTITLSGGGEPTIYWNNFTFFVDEIRSREKKLNIKTEVNLVCNGILELEQRKYIAENINHLTLSYDGIPEIQKHQRCGRQEDHQLIEETLDFLSEKRFNYTIRVTVLPENVCRITEICKYLFDKYIGLNQISFEPIAYSGRAEKMERDTGEEFLKEYLKANNYVQENYKKHIGCSLFPNTLQPALCGAWLGISPWIDAAGYIMPCNEKMDRKMYGLGRIDENGNLKYYDPQRTFHDELRQKSLGGCIDCMALHYCNGGCPIVFTRDKNGELCTESAK